MTPEQWQRITELLEAVLEREPEERPNFLREICAGDEELRLEVESLLSEHNQSGKYIDEPLVGSVVSILNHAVGEFNGNTPHDDRLTEKALKHYQILEKLGEGGMGVVYKARDTHLDRFVAIKVLPLKKVADPERKRRFVQEARAASALNHPNIITIYDIGSQGGTDFVVMEYVAGKTLDQVIPPRGLKLNEALKYSIQIADALGKAHSAGIIHRDLKPGNVMITDDGLVKVLDFGLAKLTERQRAIEENSSAPGTREVTEPGTVMGTVSYMSPEQAEGKSVDARSDIFSFGSLLYEMVTGQCAFRKDSMASTLAAILNQEPKPISKLVSSIPSHLEKVIVRCLRKDPARRFQDMDDLKVALAELKEESDSRPGSVSSGLQAARLARRFWPWLGAAFVVLAMAVGFWLFRESPRKSQAVPEVIPLTSYPGSEDYPSFSPDGNQVAFSWNGEKQENYHIYVKEIGFPNPKQLTTDPAPADDLGPVFSPDGRSIGFVRVTTEDHAYFVVIPSIGGPEQVVVEIPSPMPSLNAYVSGSLFAWFPGGKWVVTNGLMLLSIETGEIHPLTSPPNRAYADSSPAVSPDGRTIAFSRWLGWFRWGIYLLFLTENREPKGEPQQVTISNSSYLAGASSISWTPDGQELIFDSRKGLFRIAAFGGGKAEELPYGRPVIHPTISWKSNRLVYRKGLPVSNIWRLPLSASVVSAGPPSRFIASTLGDVEPQYSPDGKSIAFKSRRTGEAGIWVSEADGSNVVELFSKAGYETGSPIWSPGGQRVAFVSNFEGNQAVYLIRASGGKPVRLTSNPAEDYWPSWSRDGNWIYFTSTRSGRNEVFKAPAGGGEPVQVTRNGGVQAMESLDGNFVYYTKGHEKVFNTLWKIPVGGGEESQVLPSVVGRAFCLVNDGIYFIPEPSADGKYSIQFMSFDTGKVLKVAPIRPPYMGMLSVSPDRRYILYSQDESGSDLMLVENFKLD